MASIGDHSLSSCNAEEKWKCRLYLEFFLGGLSREWSGEGEGQKEKRQKKKSQFSKQIMGFFFNVLQVKTEHVAAPLVNLISSTNGQITFYLPKAAHTL